MKKALFAAAFGIICTTSLFAGEKKKTEGLILENDKLWGTVGTYMEATDSESQNKDFQWMTGYLKLGYDTGRIGGFKFGVEGFVHGQLYNHSKDGKDYYEKDIEKKTALSQLYIDYAFSEKTTFRIGRWNHGKLTHFDDVQTEGFYLNSTEFENLQLTVGAMRKIGDLDYDDGEDFGRLNGAQNLKDDAFYPGSRDYCLFGEVKYDLIPGNVKLNPYVYYQKGYAAVMGMDTTLQTDINESVKVGVDLKAYRVEADRNTGMNDATVWGIAPFIKFCDFTLTVGHTSFDDDNALNKPGWFKDYAIAKLDEQSKIYGQQGGDVSYVILKYKKGKFSTYLSYLESEYERTSSKGNKQNAIEFVSNYKLDCGLDLALRFLDIDYSGVDGKDYQKVEARVRYSF